MGKKYAEEYKTYTDQATLEACKHFCKWTVASLFPESDIINPNLAQMRAIVSRDYQSFGAVLLNNLAAKITQILFPSEHAFFQMSETEGNTQAAEALEVPSDVRASFYSNLELQASQRLFINGGYNALTTAVKLLIATGNALLYRDADTNKFFVYSLKNYVVKRDGSGNVLCTILKESIAYVDIPKHIQESIGGAPDNKYKSYDLYTKIEKDTTEYVQRVTSDDSKSKEETKQRVIFKVTQEIEGVRVTNKPLIYPEKLCPYIPIAWTLVNGESYGRGMVEDYSADFARYSELAESSLDYEVEIMKLLHLVNASCGAAVEDLEAAENGDYVSVPFNGEDPIKAHEGGDAAKLQVIKADMADIEMRLAKAFMYTGTTRDAERVTAEEIRTQIREADYSLGGAYSSLSESIHIPLAHILLTEQDPKIKMLLLDHGYNIDVSVGLASLSRESKVSQLQYIANAAQLIIPVLGQLSQRINTDALMSVIFEGYGFPQEQILYTDEQLAQQEAAQQQAMEESAAAMQQAGGGATIGDSNLAELNSQQLGKTQG